MQKKTQEIHRLEVAKTARMIFTNVEEQRARDALHRKMSIELIMDHNALVDGLFIRRYVCVQQLTYISEAFRQFNLLSLLSLVLLFLLRIVWEAALLFKRIWGSFQTLFFSTMTWCGLRHIAEAKPCVVCGQPEGTCDTNQDKYCKLPSPNLVGACAMRHMMPRPFYSDNPRHKSNARRKFSLRINSCEKQKYFF